MNLIADSPVVGADGEPVGTVVGVSVDASTNQVCDLTVLSFDKRVLMAIPATSITDTNEGEVALALSAERYKELADNTAGNLPEARLAREAACMPMRFGALVRCLDGPIGQLGRIIFDEYSLDVIELVIVGPQLNHEVGVPIEWASEIRDQEIVLSTQCSELRTMPPAVEDR